MVSGGGGGRRETHEVGLRAAIARGAGSGRFLGAEATDGTLLVVELAMHAGELQRMRAAAMAWGGHQRGVSTVSSAFSIGAMARRVVCAT